MPKFYLLFLLTITNLSLSAQDDLLSLLGDDNAEEIEYADASFKTNRIINLHSLENTAKGVLDFKISHRFGTLNGGPYELFGLDQAYMRIGFDYGINNKLTIGIGRSNFEKTYDGFVKYKFLRQSKGKKNMPISAGLFLGTSLKTIKWANPERENYFTSRLYYTTQLFIGRKFNDAFSLQLSPSLVHRNLVATKAEKNDVFALGIGGRYKVSRRIAINAEYVYLLPDQVATDIYNSLSLGVDIETGGHVFQLHLTNSTSMVESGFITETTNDWLDGGIHFGFNVSRVFTVSREEE
jgi:opacity protein-like surface antigen